MGKTEQLRHKSSYTGKYKVTKYLTPRSQKLYSYLGRHCVTSVMAAYAKHKRCTQLYIHLL